MRNGSEKGAKLAKIWGKGRKEERLAGSKNPKGKMKILPDWRSQIDQDPKG